MLFEFKVDSNLKQEYLDTKPLQTATSDAFVLRSVDEFESLLEKPIYDMTHSELKQMLLVQFKNSSIKAIAKNVSILKTYIDFCINKNIVLHGENRMATFTMDKIKEIVNKNAFINKYISKERLKEYQNILYNDQDKLILELLFVGVKGRPTKDGTLEELINLKIDDVDKKNRKLKLTRNNGDIRFIEVEDSTIELIEDTFNQKYYYENNGEITNNPRIPKPRKTRINHFENYVFRIPSKNKFSKFTPNILNSRLSKIQKYTDNRHITYTSIYMSGMIYMAKEIYKEKGILAKEDYVKICDRYGYGDDPEKYWFNLKEIFEEYMNLENHTF